MTKLTFFERVSQSKDPTTPAAPTTQLRWTVDEQGYEYGRDHKDRVVAMLRPSAPYSPMVVPFYTDAATQIQAEPRPRDQARAWCQARHDELLASQVEEAIKADKTP